MFANLINSSMINKLEKKLYQLIISRLNGDRIQSEEYKVKIFNLVEKGIGGFIIFGGNRDEIREFIAKIQSISEIPLFIAADIERGVGQQIRGATNFPCQMAVAAAINKDRRRDVSTLGDMIKAIATEAAGVGINMPLIPVIDVNQNPNNPIICTRAFSDNPEEVAWFGSEYIEILKNTGLITCAKHFPGHGDTAVDSHIRLPVINRTKNELMKIDIMPFVQAIKTGTDSIMIGHLLIPALDSRPASLSKKIITDLLRTELGFKGIILTDALNMQALKDFRNVAVECINAGADILLHPVDADVTVKELLSALKLKEIDENKIDNSLNYMLKIKSGMDGISEPKVDYKQNLLFSRQVSEMSITAVRSNSDILPVPIKKNAYIVFAGDRGSCKASILKNYFKSRSKTLNHELIIVAIFTSVAAWKGSSGIRDEEKQKIMELIKQAKSSIVISFGSPYVLRHFKEADMLIAAYEATEQAQMAVIKCLNGEIDFRGKLPVQL